MTTTYVKSAVTDEATDAESPVNETLMQLIARNINYLNDVTTGGGVNSLPYASGDYELGFDVPGGTTESGSTYVKHFEVVLPRGGVVKTVMTFANDNNPSGDAYARIYVNGVATGTERTEGGGGTYTEDITLGAGPVLLQVYLKATGGGNSKLTDFFVRVSAATALIPARNATVT